MNRCEGAKGQAALACRRNKKSGGGGEGGRKGGWVGWMKEEVHWACIHSAFPTQKHLIRRITNCVGWVDG